MYEWDARYVSVTSVLCDPSLSIAATWESLPR